MIAFFFAVDKGLAFLRQIVIARSFGLSADLDAFNVANNVPDLLFALISGGALASAFIPVLTETLTQQGRPAAWNLFSRIANLAFIITAILALVVGVLAGPLIRWEMGIAPGFNGEQQELVATLMRLNLMATMIFSLSGLVMASLQANQSFLLPALAPGLYNIGQIFGALVLAPEKGYTLGGVTLPAFGLGVHGLVYGVIIGALLHLGIQIPGMIRYQFRWTPRIGLRDAAVQKVLRLMGPRLLTMFAIQLIFLLRDNLASRLEAGAVSALTYGWMIMQVPETLIGTAVAIVLLPTLAEQFTRQDYQTFQATIQRALRALLSISLPLAAVLAFGLRPLLVFAFHFDTAQTDLLLWVARGYLLGMTSYCLLEIGSRSFYAQQNTLIPLLTAVFKLGLYTLLGISLYRPLGAPGISLTDALAFTGEAILLLTLLNRRLVAPLQIGGTLLRAVLGAVLGGATAALALWGLSNFMPALFASLAALSLGGLVAILPGWKEARLILKL